LLSDVNSESQMDLVYENKGCSETMKQTRGLQVLGMTINPICERRLGKPHTYIHTYLPTFVVVEGQGGIFP